MIKNFDKSVQKASNCFADQILAQPSGIQIVRLSSSEKYVLSNCPSEIKITTFACF